MPDDLPDLPPIFVPSDPPPAPKPFVQPQGGPAFPLYPSHSCEEMTLRDYFAAAALTGYIAGPDEVFVGRKKLA